MSLDAAIAQLEVETALYAQVTQQQPGEGTQEWFVLRAKALGLSCLRRMKQLGVGDSPRSAELFYREASKYTKTRPDSGISEL